MKKGIQFKIEDGKLMKKEILPLKRVNVGNCYYCHQPVWVAQGQAIKWKIKKTSISDIELPTHKACRKRGLVL